MNFNWHPITELINQALVMIIAVFVYAIFVWLNEKYGLLFELSQIIKRIWKWKHVEEAALVLVNVQYRDALGLLLDLGPFVTVTMHNGKGGVHTLVGGFFIGCDPRIVHEGTHGHLNIQYGKYREDLVVEYDPKRETLFVRSRLRKAKIIAKIMSGSRGRISA